ncbi:hypothetical protein GCM10010912_53020 [Paenibacillus albidus]|uniref:Heparin-sulfate lyase N-terminal domain-containing protein n=2 Tax=Paenibacillus albidus TaxID=2041023 RepID=A0A917CXH7_9BACL|nr:hypothetical protein GCM10010912_53020 [Paenibacillus albidus]
MKLKGYKELRNDPKYTKPLPTDEVFLREVLELGQPGLEQVRLLLDTGDVQGARNVYLQHMDSAQVKRYYFDINDVPRLMQEARSRYAWDAEALQDIAEADRITQGDLPIFKDKRVYLPDGKYNWNSWLYDSSQYQLHLTRFTYVKRLSRAYTLTGDEKYAACFNHMMEDFILDNPVPVDGTFRGEHCTWDPLSVGYACSCCRKPLSPSTDRQLSLPK